MNLHKHGGMKGNVRDGSGIYELNACLSTIRRIGRNEACFHATFSRACVIHILCIRSHERRKYGYLGYELRFSKR